ncbi:MAG: hypothetical protein ABF649_13475 [Bacillus sp. (in: firmicutes)]
MFPTRMKNRVHVAPIIGAAPIAPPIVHGAIGAPGILHGSVPSSAGFISGNPVVIYPYKYFSPMHSNYPNNPSIYPSSFYNPYANYFPPYY